MANAARDPYVQASIRRETIDHPMRADDIEDECAACHMPAAQKIAHAAGAKGGSSPTRRAAQSAPGQGSMVWRLTACPARSVIRSRRTDWGRRTRSTALLVAPPLGRLESRRAFGPSDQMPDAAASCTR